MSVALRTYTADERRLHARDDAMNDMLSMTAGQSGLSHEAEMDIRRAVGHQVETLLGLADSAVAVRLELEAVESRLSRHGQWCLDCRRGLPCLDYRNQLANRDRLLRRWDAAYRALVGEKR